MTTLHDIVKGTPDGEEAIRSALEAAAKDQAETERKAMTTPQNKGQEELREKVLERIDAWRFDAEWQTSRASDFPQHKGAGCGCGVCQKIHGLNGVIADDLMRLFNQELEARVKEARVSENQRPLTFSIDDSYSAHYKNGFRMAVQQFDRARELRIAELSQPKETL